MPFTILADSDDDGDAEDLAPNSSEDKETRSPSTANNGALNTQGAGPAYDGTNDRSTGSTERLRRQIASAERGLCINSAPMTTASEPSPHSPSKLANKRRHTAEPASDITADRGIKRAATLKTYSRKDRRRATVGDDDIVMEDAVRRTHGAGPSQSVKFSDHSGLPSSTGLPYGSLGQDFIGHEPTIMFPESGSTEEDTSSMQRRLLKEAWQSNEANNARSTSCMIHLAAHEDVNDAVSPIPSSAWVKPSENGLGANASEQNEQNGALADGQTESSHAESRVNGTTPSGHNCQAPSGTMEYSEDAIHLSKPTASPVVQIPHSEPLPASPDNKEQQRKKRKRDLADEAKLPLSEDRLLTEIGLPKEMYQPRPSKRRATHSVDDFTQLVALPEKSSRSKRRKTTQVEELTQGTEESERDGGSKKTASKETERETLKSEAVRSEKEDPTKATSAVSDDATPSNNVNTQERTPAKLQPTVSPAEPKNDHDVFVKPPKPTPKSKLKSRRSHTTIFEDHVEFSESQRSPSLSQQQASRKSALRDVENDASRSSPKKRKRGMDDGKDESMENDVGKDELQEEAPPPKKRGRGRPRKSSPKPPPKSKRKVLEDSEDDDDEWDELDAVGDAPKKKGEAQISNTRGSAHLPEKASANPEPQMNGPGGNSSTEPAQQRDNDSPSIPKTSNTDANPANNCQDNLPPTETADATPKPRSKSNTPAPSSKAGPAPSTTTAAPEPKKSPTSHSPLKSSSKVPLRVGLNKRQRIPSLLRTINPPRAR